MEPWKSSCLSGVEFRNPVTLSLFLSPLPPTTPWVSACFCSA
uniref:Uncharacterized protein n=1 Tax=Rhizophora mucronata TaxID=61149 RepID=A0A2P2N9D3_RHIMU